jgi:Amt family ammonium transporter
MAVPITNTDTSFGTQAIGVLAIGAFTLLLSFTAWTLIKAVMGLRLPAEEEAKGLDIAELEVSGYPYFEERAAARS